MENEYIITFPSKMQSDPRTFENILEQVSNIPLDVSVIKYDITKISWIDGELSSFLACVFEDIQSRFKTASQYVQLNDTRSDSETLLIKNKLLPYYLPIPEIPDTYRTTVPFQNFYVRNGDRQVATEQVEDYLNKYVYSHKDWSTNFGDSQEELDFSTSIYELIRNIIDHSRTNKLLISGQFYPNKEEFSLAISDIGVGIPLTVQNQTPGLKTHAERINWATNKGNTSKNNMQPRGLGLYTIKNRMKNIGSLTIVSRLGYWKMDDKGTIHEYSLSNEYPGTYVKIVFNRNLVKKSKLTISPSVISTDLAF